MSERVEKIDLLCDEETYQIIITATHLRDKLVHGLICGKVTHLVFGYRKRMRICSCASPRHGERPVERDLQSLGYMDTTHSTRTFDEDVGVLTRVPGCL